MIVLPPVGETPRTIAPPPRLTVSLEVLAAKPPFVSCTWPAAVPAVMVKLPDVWRTPPLRTRLLFAERPCTAAP